MITFLSSYTILLPVLQRKFLGIVCKAFYHLVHAHLSSLSGPCMQCFGMTEIFVLEEDCYFCFRLVAHIVLSAWLRNISPF